MAVLSSDLCEPLTKEISLPFHFRPLVEHHACRITGTASIRSDLSEIVHRQRNTGQGDQARCYSYDRLAGILELAAPGNCRQQTATDSRYEPLVDAAVPGV